MCRQRPQLEKSHERGLNWTFEPRQWSAEIKTVLQAVRQDVQKSCGPGTLLLLLLLKSTVHSCATVCYHRWEPTAHCRHSRWWPRLTFCISHVADKNPVPFQLIDRKLPIRALLRHWTIVRRHYILLLNFFCHQNSNLQGWPTGALSKAYQWFRQ